MYYLYAIIYVLHCNNVTFHVSVLTFFSDLLQVFNLIFLTRYITGRWLWLHCFPCQVFTFTKFLNLFQINIWAISLQTSPELFKVQKDHYAHSFHQGGNSYQTCSSIFVFLLLNWSHSYFKRSAMVKSNAELTIIYIYTVFCALCCWGTSLYFYRYLQICHGVSQIAYWDCPKSCNWFCKMLVNSFTTHFYAFCWSNYINFCFLLLPS